MLLPALPRSHPEHDTAPGDYPAVAASYSIILP